MSENEANNIDLIKQIPDCEISWDEFSDASFEGGTMSLHSVYPDYSRPDDQGAGADFENWHEQHSWVPLDNIRGCPYFARTLHHNEKSRSFVERLDVDTGIAVIQGLVERSALSHVCRMLSADNCDILTDFSLAWMEYLSEETQTRRQEISYKVPDSTDGSSALQFWTIAPYLYDQLVKKGIEEQTAFKAVLDWSASRNETRGTNLDAVYPGVKNLKNYGDGGWFLSKNPDGESHKLAEKVGSHIADHIAPIYRVGNIDS